MGLVQGLALTPAWLPAQGKEKEEEEMGEEEMRCSQNPFMLLYSVPATELALGTSPQGFTDRLGRKVHTRQAVYYTGWCSIWGRAGGPKAGGPQVIFKVGRGSSMPSMGRYGLPPIADVPCWAILPPAYRNNSVFHSAP